MPNFPGLSKEAALILGGLAALVNAIVVIAGLGAFEDGFQLADLIPIIGPILAAGGIREYVYSQESVERMLNQRGVGTTLPKGNEYVGDPPDDTAARKPVRKDGGTRLDRGSQRE